MLQTSKTKKKFNLQFKLTSHSLKKSEPDHQESLPIKDDGDPNENNNNTNDNETNEKNEKTDDNTEYEDPEDEQNKIQIQRNLDDLVATDINQRTILHRAALEQNEDLLTDIVNDYSDIWNNTPLSERKMKPLFEFINSPDKFGNTPLLNACSLRLDIDTSNSTRLNCVKLLVANGADVNSRNNRTFWNAMFWVAYHGDEACAKLLIERNIEINQPDDQGFYPLDVAGKQNNTSVASLLIAKLCDEIVKYNHQVYEENQRVKESLWESPMLKTSILFWSIKFKEPELTLKEICDWTKTYIECPLFLNHQMTPIHMAAQEGYDKGLAILLDKTVKKAQKLREDEDFLKKTRHLPKFSFSLEFNEIFPIPKEKQKKYDAKFRSKILKYAKWVHKYEREIVSIMSETVSEEKKKAVFFDEPDLYGNTPLHLASMLGKEACVKLLISAGSDIDKQNREGFRPIELAQNPKIKRIYLEEIQELRNAQTKQEKKKREEIRAHIDKLLIKEKRNKLNSLRKKSFVGRFRKQTVVDEGQATVNIAAVDNMFNKFQVYTPEFVIRFRKKARKTKKNTSFYDRNNVKDDENADRINFYISLLINAHFDVYLAPSIDEDSYYVMLSLSEQELIKQCHILKMRLKLVDSYNYQIFDKEKKANFEPLRSRQKQEIIFNKVNSILDLHMLKKEGLVESFFMMHSSSGIAQIRKKWIVSPKWYWPQPLNQIDDYLLEGKSQNFSSVTSLKQYLGEKISFYFAWRSFNTCFLLPIAIPGLVIQIYIIAYDDYHSELLPFWVFFVSLWSTIMVEFWKRKCSEINTRWGTLDLMNDDSWMSNEFRKEFSGDECVSSVSQQITKFNPTKITIYAFLASLPVLIVLLFCCGGTYYLTQMYKDTYQSSLNSTIAGFVNGIVITLLNFLYTFIARWFVKKENHKYARDFENSLIVKSFSFRILNSFYAVFYLAFIEAGSDFKDLFGLLWPILIYKQASNIAVQVMIPWIKYKYHQKKYFKEIQKKAIEQKQMNTSRMEKLEENDDVLDIAQRSGLVYGDYWDRIVMYMKDKDCKKIRNCDMDQVELNYHRDSFIDTVDYYAEGFIAFGYVTMFTAAFPIGPMIALVVDTAELKWKVFSFLFALKRPVCEKSVGIGMWMDIWEGMSIAGVFTNFLLLFFSKKVTFSTFLSSEDQIYRLWLTIIMVCIIIFVKFLFRAVIPDKPKWVIDEEERQKAQRELKKSTAEVKFSSSKLEKEIIEEKTRIKARINDLRSKLEKSDRKIKELESEKEKFKKQLKEKALTNSVSSTIFQQTPQDFKANALSLFLKTFTAVERELLLIRLEEIAKYEGNLLLICNECHKAKAILECLDCEENYCKRCYEDLHITTHRMMGKPQPNIASFPKISTDIIPSDYKLVDRAKFIREKKQIETSKKKVNKKINPEEKILQEWKKFEYFSLPIYEKSSFFPNLIKIFSVFYRLYIENNGFIPGKNLISVQTAVSEIIHEENNEISNNLSRNLEKNTNKNPQSNLPPLEFKEIKGNFMRIRNGNLIEIIENEDFNIEDKLFLNRLAFLGFRKFGQQFKFKDFHKFCKKLQKGNSLQKMVLFIEMLELSEGMIDKKTVEQFISSSIMRNVFEENKKYSDIINEMFNEEISVKKTHFVEMIDAKNNADFKNIMGVFMQQTKNPN